jgi:hypothetical protein
MEVNMKFDFKNGRSTISSGWMTFREIYDLEVGDFCKFVMVKRRAFVFGVVIK